MTEYAGTYTIIGPPGTGKTTWLAAQASKLIREGVTPLICSLTNSAANEIAGRDIPMDRKNVGTLHSLALKSLERPAKLADVKIWNSAYPAYPLSYKCLGTGDDDLLPAETNAGDQLFSKAELLRHRMTPREFWPRSVLEFQTKWDEFKFETDTMDFTDMIEESLLRQTPPPGEPQAIIADEAADLSRLEYTLLSMWAKNQANTSALFFVCGDPWQSIYTWRGADPEIFDDPAVPATHRKVLTQSYRIPREVHKFSMRWIKQLSNYKPIEYQPRDYDGEICDCSSKYNNVLRINNMVEDYFRAGKSIMIMASCEYLLKPTITDLRTRGIPFSNPWRIANGAWNPLSNRRGVTMKNRILSLLKMDTANNKTISPWTLDEFLDWATVLQAEQIFKRGVKNKLDELIDRMDLTGSWTQFLSCINEEKIRELGMLLQQGRTADVLLWWMEKIEPSKKQNAEYPVHVANKNGLKSLREDPKLYVGTIHSFKGGEADVVIIYPDLSTKGMIEWCNVGRNRDPIIRTFYVALTRAKETVCICQPAGMSSNFSYKDLTIPQ